MAEMTVPSATEAYGIAWRELKRCALELFLLVVVWGVLCAPSGWLQDNVFGLAYNVLVLGPVSFGGMYAFLRTARGEKPEVGDLFAAFQRNYVQAVLASLLVSALVVIGLVLLIVPGVIAMVRLAWVPYLVIDEGYDAVPAVRESWARTRPYAATILGILLLAIPLVIVGFLLLLVGAIVAIVWAHLASAVLYAAVSTRDRLARDAGVAPPVR